MFAVGLMQALGITLLISFYNVYLRVAVQEWQVQPVVFTCVCLMVSAFVLSLCAGPGRFVRETLRSPVTWLYSAVLIGAYVVDVYVMHYVSATEASFFSRMTIPISLFIAWAFFKRQPEKSDLAGLTLILAGLIWLVMLQPSASLWVILFVVGLSALFQTIQYVIAETHKEAVSASETGTIRDKARVVGFVTFVSSFVFLIVSLILSYVHYYFNVEALAAITFIPEPSGFIHLPTVLAASFYGLCILPFIRYFKWAASYNLKAENLLVFMAFIPVLTYLIEVVAGMFIHIPSNAHVFDGERGEKLLFIGVLLTLGAGLTAFLKVRAEIVKQGTNNGIWHAMKEAFTPEGKSLVIEHTFHGMDDYETVCAAIEYCEGGLEKASDALGVPATSIEVIRDGRGRHAFIPQISRDVSRRFRQNVALSDALTGLDNRTAFMAALKAGTASKRKFSVLFMDLDKFKPINDTYGHEAGDEVLKAVAERLLEVLPKSACIARLGGDEFVALLKADKTKVQSHMNKISEVLRQPFDVKNSSESISIGVSIGVAHYPDDAKTAKDLLNFADVGMYRGKNER
ncbi:MAG: diguanylate cyclase [Pseudomonadota bacterium]|nr:diguanylate cyclase [Pseudomonadota bacterium]